MGKEIYSKRLKAYIDPLKWCRFIVNTAYFIVAFIILAHVVWFFAARSILAHPPAVYLLNYILLPAIGLFSLVIVVDMLVRSERVPLLSKEFLSLSLFIAFSFYLSLTHPIAKVLLGSFILAIFASTIFFNLNLTRWMFWLSNFAVLVIAVIYRLNGALDGDMIMQVFVACFMFVCSFLLAKVLVLYSQNNLATLTSFDKNQQNLQEQLKLDPFTSLNNRKTFDESLLKLFNDCKHSGKSLSLAMIDIDHFKKINDRLGHSAGDRVLLYLSQKLKGIQSDSIQAFRVGGDEFMLIFQGLNPEETHWVCEDLLIHMHSFPLRANDSDPITISCGIVSLNTKTTNPEALVKAADSALYAAKNNGRDQIVVKDNF